MVLLDELKALKDEKIDLIRMALNKYSTPYRISGYDATTLNNLTNFISNNIIYKKRQDYSENELSSLLYKYSYKYFTQFVTPESTLELLEMMILYNKYMIFNIAENAMKNIFGISERFIYKATLINHSNNINQNSDKIYSISIPYVSGEYRQNFTRSFKVKSNQIVNGTIISINDTPSGFFIATDFELLV